MNRRHFLRLASLTTTLYLIGCRQSRLGNRKPNVLYIMSDDHAAHAISAYGSAINRTPSIDRLANEGMLFKNCFCTNSICAPSRAVILTGAYSHINGQTDNAKKFDGSQITFPKLFQQAGYETALIGKWHLGSLPTGFDYWKILPGQGCYYNPDFIHMDGSMNRCEGYCTDLITDFTLEWLQEKRDKSKPFLLFCQHKAPHRNWSPPARYLGLHREGSIPEPKTLFDDYATRSPAAAQSQMSILNHMSWRADMKFQGENLFPEFFASELDPSERPRMTEQQKQLWDSYYEPQNAAFIAQMKEGKLSPSDVARWKYQRYMHDYLGSVAAVDEGVGRLLDYLDKTGLSENTVVIYTSDQGFFLGDHGWYDKRFMYEPSLRMPLLVRYPATVKSGSVNEDIVLNLDFASTLLDMAGIEIPPRMQGRSFYPLLKGEKPNGWRTAMYYHYSEYPAVHQVKRHYGIRTLRYKLIHFYYDIDAWELYDLQHDPDELNNLYEHPDYESVVRSLKQQLRELMIQYQETQFLDHLRDI